MHQRFADDVIVDGVREEGNAILAVIAALIAGTLASLLWVSYTALTGQHVSWLALVVAGIVGLAVRFVGGGTTSLFGLIGVVFTLLASLSGQVSAEIFTSMSKLYDFYGVLMHINLGELSGALARQATPTAYALYAVALIGAYRVSIQKPRKL